jgi:hypothetical protein
MAHQDFDVVINPDKAALNNCLVFLELHDIGLVPLHITHGHGSSAKNAKQSDGKACHMK